MSDSSPRLMVYIESLFSRIVQKRQEKRLSKLQEISEGIDLLEKEYAPQEDENASKVFTEKEVLCHLYLNPRGVRPDDMDNIMNSSIAKNYFDVGILTQGVSSNMESQYRLTALGHDQVKYALALELLN